MSEILKHPVTYWLKRSNGDVISVSTNSRCSAEWMKRDLNTKRPDGLILRTTKEQAEKDPKP